MKNEIYRRIIEQVRLGDVDAFQELYLRLRNKVKGFSLKLVKSQEEAAEMTQDVFLMLWENHRQLDPTKNIEAYLFVIVRSKFLDSIKRRRSWEKYVLSQNSQEPMESSIDQQIDLYECQFLLEEAIDTLPSQAKKVYAMSREKGMTHKEIATVLKISTHTVYNHVKYALRHIKNHLNKVSPEILTFLILSFLF